MALSGRGWGGSAGAMCRKPPVGPFRFGWESMTGGECPCEVQATLRRALQPQRLLVHLYAAQAAARSSTSSTLSPMTKFAKLR
jgi:hypothetical protein